jgi:hypothetical protein
MKKYNLSTICKTANKLRKQGYSLAQSFVIAWAMAKGQETKVSGTSKFNRQTALEHLTKYQPEEVKFTLVREPENQFDKNAVAVMVSVNGSAAYKIGYIPAVTAPIVSTMLIFKIKNDDIAKINENESFSFPKYTTQIMNLANQNAQGTRNTVVGQLSDLFPEYLKGTSSASLDNWKKWYISKYPNALKDATLKILSQIENLKQALLLITEDMIEKWVEDLVINKTYDGMYIQKAIISTIASNENKAWRLATKEEECKGIDGYIGDEPVSIKPDTYQHMGHLNEQIAVKIITYSKKKDCIIVSY